MSCVACGVVQACGAGQADTIVNKDQESCVDVTAKHKVACCVDVRRLVPLSRVDLFRLVLSHLVLTRLVLWSRHTTQEEAQTDACDTEQDISASVRRGGGHSIAFFATAPTEVARNLKECVAFYSMADSVMMASPN